MPRWSKEDYERYQSKHSSGNPGLPALYPQSTQGDALVSAAPRKGKGRKGTVRDTSKRRLIVFRVFSVRPADWDAYSIKELQDCLVHAGILDGDDWNLLHGTVISEKAHSKEEEMTIVEIT